MGCIGSRDTRKELPNKDYDRKVIKRRRILAGIIVKKAGNGLEADFQTAYISEKDDTFKTDEVKADISELPAIGYISH